MSRPPEQTPGPVSGAPRPEPGPGAGGPSGLVLGTLGRVGDGAPRARSPEEVRRIEAVNAALIHRIERMTDTQSGAFSLFQTALHLESQVRGRTAELSQALRRVEQTSRENRAAREQADRANRSKTRFLAAAGHDILQPLNAARLSLSTLQAPGTDESGRQRCLDTIAGALDTMEELIASVLDMARIDAGAVRPEPASVPLRRLLDGVAREFQPLAARKGLRLRAAGDPAILGRTDPALFRRVVANLVSNAVRYTCEGGVLLSVRRRGGAAGVEVRDTGIGIPADQHELVFEEFHRGRAVGADAAATAAGLGLGLSIVRRLSAALDHPLALRSVEGRGTLVRIDVSLSGPDERPPAALQPRADPLAGRRIGLAGPDTPARAEAAGLLARWGCRVEPEPGPGEAPDLLLLSAEAGDGAAAQRLDRRRAALGRSVPAILVGPAEAGAGAGIGPGDPPACGRLPVPVKPAALRALAMHLLGGST